MPLVNSDKLLVGSVYRPPSNSKEDNAALYNTILSLIEGRSHVLLGGDFNQSDIDWREGTTPKCEASPGAIFMEFVHDSFLFQHVSEPTHFRGTQTPTLIDLVFSNEENMVQNVTYKQPLGKSHHVCIYFDFICYAERTVTSSDTIYNYRKADYEGMRKHVSNVCSQNHKAFETKSAEDSYEYLSDIIQTAIEKYVPKIETSSCDRKLKPPWWSKKASEKIQKKSTAYEK